MGHIMDEDRKEFCKLVDLAIQDEQDAVDMYGKMSKVHLKDRPQESLFAELTAHTVLSSIGEQEATHKDMLETIKTIMCKPD